MSDGLVELTSNGVLNHARILVYGDAAVEVAHTRAVGHQRSAHDDGAVNVRVCVAVTGVNHAEVSLNDDQPEVVPVLTEVYGEVAPDDQNSLTADAGATASEGQRSILRRTGLSRTRLRTPLEPSRPWR